MNLSIKTAFSDFAADCGVGDGTVSYNVEFNRAGLLSFTVQLTGQGGIVLFSDTASFNCDTGRRVYLDDSFRGVAPITFEDLAPGTHRVRVDLAAHDSMARNVVLARAESAVEEFHLVPNCGSLRVCTSPAGVTVFVDGKMRGTTAPKPDGTDQISEALDIDLVLAGSREILFTREGYHEQRRTIDVLRDQTATLDIKLRRRFIPDFEVRTAENVYKGVLHNRTAEFLRLETEPGVIRSFPIKTVISSRVLRDDERVEQEP